MIRMSKANNNNINCVGTPWLKISEKAVLDNLTSSKSCGMMIGNPSIAIKEACCMAFEAIAASMVNTKLNPIAPTKLIKKNCIKEVVKSPIKAVKSTRLMVLINNIKITLYVSLDKMKTTGEVIE